MTESYVVAFGDKQFWVMSFGRVGPARPSPYSVDDIAGLKWQQVLGALLLTHPDHPPHRLVNRAEANYKIEPVT